MREEPISSVAEVNPPLSRHVSNSELVSFVRMSDVTESGRLVSSETVPFGSVMTGYTRFLEGDVLFAKITPCMENGKGAIAEGLVNGLGCGSTEFHVLRARPNNSREFIFHILQWNEFRQKAEAFMSGSAGQRRVPADFFSKHHVSIPEFRTQQKIAAVLSTIDTAIEKTEALIEKYQQIKAGLMHDLFTRGVLPNGQLRPAREEAPELYQETPLGWIPNEWALERCADLCTRICVGIVIQPTQYYVADGVPAFRSANVREEGIDPSNFVFISRAANTLLMKSQVKTGDILSVRTGYPGTSAVVPKEFQGANCIDILISSPGERVSSEFLCEWINSSFGKEQVLRQQGGMAQQHFNVGEMRELLVAVSSKDEQQRIEDRFNAVAKNLRKEKELLEKLRHQKLGLMQDLLTGKVPAKVAAAEMEPA